MIDFVVAVNSAMNIFGLDANRIIISDKTISGSFITKLASQDAIEEYRKLSDDCYAEIWMDPQKSQAEKLDFFAEKFANKCRETNLRAKNLVFKLKDEMVVIEIPAKEINMSSDQEIIDRAVELIQYTLIAEPLFHFSYKSFLVLELAADHVDSLQVWMQAEDLRNYHLHQANIYDLLYDGIIYKNKTDLNIQVYFAALEEIEMKSFTQVRKGRKRD